LFQLNNPDVGLPLSRFMMKPLDREGIFDLLRSMNSGLKPDQQLKEADLVDVFDGMWQKLKDRLDAVPAEAAPPAQASERSERELLEEILLLLRSTTRRPSPLVERALRTAETGGAGEWSSLFNRLRDIAGPEGLVQISGKEITIKSPRLDKLAADEIGELRSLEAYFKDSGVDFKMLLLDEPADA
jgi:hypothetical protein